MNKLTFNTHDCCITVFFAFYPAYLGSTTEKRVLQSPVETVAQKRAARESPPPSLNPIGTSAAETHYTHVTVPPRSPGLPDRV